MRKPKILLPFHTITERGPAEIPPEILAFATLVGRVTLQWTALQEALAELFAEVVTPDNHPVAVAIWNALQNDKNQRDQLLAAAEETFVAECRALNEIKWLVNRTGETAGDRNRLIHSPFTLRWNWGNSFVAPSKVTSNRRAVQLGDKDLAAEANRCIVRLVKLSCYAHQLRQAISSDLPDDEWPQQPQL